MHIGYHLQVHLHVTTDQNLKIATIDQPHATIMKTGTDTVGLDHNPILADTTAKVAMTHTEAFPGHITGTTEDITGVVPDDHTQTLVHSILAATLHIKDYLHTGAHQITTEITADHVLDQPTIQLRKPHINLHHIPEDHKVKHIPKKNSGVTIDDPQMDFYSSDNHSSDSEEDSDHLN